MELNYIINGTTPFSSMIRKIIEAEGGKVLCFTTLRKFIDSTKIEELPIVATEDLADRFDIGEIFVVNTVGYTKMNTIREKAQSELDAFNLRTVSYISKKANVYSDDIGKGCIIMPGAFVGPNVKLGKGNIIYSNVFSKKGIRNSQSNMQTFSISPQDRTKILSLQIRRDGTCVKKYFSLLAQSYT